MNDPREVYGRSPAETALDAIRELEHRNLAIYGTTHPDIHLPGDVFRDLSWPAIRMADLKDTKMSIEMDLPPNIDAIDAVFKGVKARAAKDGIYFCYGNTIYNPGGRGIELQIIAHECTHALQQGAMGTELWWDAYLKVPAFRLAMELDAHRVEYQQYVKANPGRAFRRRYLAMEAERLSGPLYNRMVTKDRAKTLIKED